GYLCIGPFCSDYESIFIDGHDTSGNASGNGFPINGQYFEPVDVGSVTNGSGGRLRPFRGQIAAVRITDGVPPAYPVSIPPPPGTMFMPERQFTASNGTILLWTLDEGTGSTAHDTSGRGNNGQITGAMWTGGGPP